MTATRHPTDRERSRRDARRSRARRSGGRARPLHVFLLVVALFWLVPTFGLLVGVLRARPTTRDAGWWTAFDRPAS